ncbi:MAG: protein-export chaperone SecB [Methylophilaceae bacterium]|jgi:preprotein translocase subunit SecB|nr:MAG: protein-export chaperone SecB [Methylophilaceae bacterium]
MAKDNQATENKTEQETAEAGQNTQPGFAIEKLYVKDASIEVPNAPQIFTNRTAPQVNVELGNSATRLEDGIFEVAIKVTVTAKVEETTAFLVEATQAGVFAIRGIPDENLEVVLAITCPNILFPYAREAVSDMVTRAGFMPVLLNPINFEALYAQQKMEQNASQTPS